MLRELGILFPMRIAVIETGFYVLLAFVITVIFLYAPHVSQAQSPACARQATQNDVDALAGKVKLGDCIDAATLAIINPDESGPAKNYLKSLQREPNKCQTNSDASIDALSSDFAICAARFLKAYTQQYGTTYKITSAYRSVDQQKCVCPQAVNGLCASPGKSNHQRGVAMDVHPLDGSYRRIADFAKANPQFGVCFPLAYKATPDRPHLILAGVGGGESNNCASQGVTTSCTGKVSFADGSTATATSLPSSGLTNVARNLFSSLNTSSQDTQCQSLSQQCNSGNSSACTTFMTQCQQGEAAPSSSSYTAPTGASTATQSQGTGTISDAYSTPASPTEVEHTTTNADGELVDDGTTDSTATSSLSIVDQLLLIAGETTTSTTSTSTPNPLPTTTVTYLAQQQAQIQPQSTYTSQPSYTQPTLGVTYVPAADTFGQTTYTQTSMTTEESNAILAALNNARTVLESMLSYLSPFSPLRYQPENVFVQDDGSYYYAGE